MQKMSKLILCWAFVVAKCADLIMHEYNGIAMLKEDSINSDVACHVSK